MISKAPAPKSGTPNLKIAFRALIRASCEIFGLDPFQVACEGRFVAFVPADHVSKGLSILNAAGTDGEACQIGTVVGGHKHRVALKSSIGAQRILDMASGEQLPRIC
jgi:hydrogenase expression/formation protein HypE